jgi:NADPH-dependent 2,4-dienoyl-CoA reductase/sulfur reductase-like enzyme
VQSIAVVGASLAGVRAAEALREEGFDGSLTIVGDDAARPYDRPPLSKHVLSGEWDPARIRLPAAAPDAALDAEWRLGVAATGLDLHERRIALSDGGSVAFDGLVIATGAAARRLPIGDGLAGVHVLRTLADCIALRADLEAGPQRVAVIGAGFIGGEVAATCRGRGLAVTVIEALPVPLGRILGDELGTMVGDLHRDHGVDLRLGVGVADIRGTDRVEAVELADGSVVEADVVVVGVGVAPNTGWLDGSGLTVDNGVVCDVTCLAAPGVVAAGDVARWPNPLFDEVMRVEHWDNAIEQGAHAARTLLAGEGGGRPYAPVPWFWSDQYDRKLQLAGRPRPDDEMVVVQGSIEERRFLALYGRAGKVVGVVGMNRPAPVMRYRARIAEGLGWNEALAEA